MTSDQEIGAAVAVYRDGVKVVDLWGGYRNSTVARRHSRHHVSTTKGVSSLAVAVAASQGLISYDAKVADYWPEFAQADKGRSNRAAAKLLRGVADPATMSAKIAAQAPAWTPGTRHAQQRAWLDTSCKSGPLSPADLSPNSSISIR